ncbi:MAG: signal peptidase II [Deltaproteobacteria bacterium]|nr:MAG: signal peptidase II [Deltaproteobacteria bacterium]
MNNFFKKWPLILGLASIVFALDQWSKHWIVENVPRDIFMSVIPGLFDIIHTRNKGAAFGFMAEMPENIRMPFFFVSSIVALVGMLYYFSREYPENNCVHISLGLILGGALGNIYDRITLGEVVDFLSFHYYDRWADFTLLGHYFYFRLEWPAFNIADSAICLAITLLLFFMLSDDKRNKKGVLLP